MDDYKDSSASSKEAVSADQSEEVVDFHDDVSNGTELTSVAEFTEATSNPDFISVIIKEQSPTEEESTDTETIQMKISQAHFTSGHEEGNLATPFKSARPLPQPPENTEEQQDTNGDGEQAVEFTVKCTLFCMADSKWNGKCLNLKVSVIIELNITRKHFLQSRK